MPDDGPGPAPATLRGRVWSLLARTDRVLGLSALFPTPENAVLMYHSVGAGTGNTADRTLPVAEFRAGIRRLTEHYQVVDLPAVLARGDRRRVAITFDDGFENVHANALPVLREFDAPATCFLISDRIGGTTETGVPYLSESQVVDLVESDLVTVGNHTRNHPWLSGIDDEATLRAEILGAQADLEDRFGCEVDRFCYPYGDYSAAALELVRESHAHATAGAGLVGQDADPHLIPRVDGAGPPSLVRWELTGLAERLRGLASG